MIYTCAVVASASQRLLDVYLIAIQIGSANMSVLLLVWLQYSKEDNAIALRVLLVLNDSLNKAEVMESKIRRNMYLQEGLQHLFY